MSEQTPQPAAPTNCTCAVCGTPYPRPVEHALRRCPKCGSRLIRAEEGSVLGIAAHSTAPPPKPTPERQPRHRGPGIATGDRRQAGFIVTGIVMASIGLVMGLRTWSGAMFMMVPGGADLMYLGLSALLLVSGVIFFVRGLASTSRAGGTAGSSGLPRHSSCPFCAYPIPFGHIGRCPECGRLQNPLHPSNYRCPHCRRDLHRFSGDNCPECGGDVRTVTDGPRPEEEA